MQQEFLNVMTRLAQIGRAMVLPWHERWTNPVPGVFEPASLEPTTDNGRRQPAE